MTTRTWAERAYDRSTGLFVGGWAWGAIGLFLAHGPGGGAQVVGRMLCGVAGGLFVVAGGNAVRFNRECGEGQRLRLREQAEKNWLLRGFVGRRGEPEALTGHRVQAVLWGLFCVLFGAGLMVVAVRGPGPQPVRR